ncbi:hypothetical protein [Blastococcus deserti]|uniref:Uncharacterized protein n=1 Tax=Blastococcus deserti TaxID=2259033 RepID=A0ABW4X7Q4_9ACTN
MLPDGLHIGLAAWIAARREGDGFPAWPALPLETRLVDLEALQTVHDLARAAEFARMVNFLPQKGAYADPFGGTQPLWGLHRDLLGRMVFAVRAWTAAEDEQWRAARRILWEEGPDGSPRMTSAFRLYDELRLAYQQLVEAGAGAAELTVAHAAWTATGHKLEVEAALATINRLARRSSLPQAENERLSLEPDRLPATTDGSYAVTTFSPVSAVRVETWLTAEATLDELEAAVGDAQPRAKWTAWRSVRTGAVRFRYAVLDLHRAWFTGTLYRADDWRLGDGSVAAAGDGAGGQIPAYVRSVYLVSLEEVRTGPKPPLPDPRPPPFPRFPVVVDRVRPRPGLHAPAESRLSLSEAPRAGVMVSASPPAPADVSVMPVHPVALAASTRAPDLEWHAAPLGRLRVATVADFSQRLTIATTLIAVQESSSAPSTGPVPPTAPVFVVGFGCVPLPASPQPNPAYQWTLP